MQDSIQTDEVLLDSVQVATMLGVSTHFIVAHSTGKKAPRISFVKVGNRVRFEQQAVREFIAARTRKKV
jgi:predicted DNA-binding transcriptional regulator AlpA